MLVMTVYMAESIVYEPQQSNQPEMFRFCVGGHAFDFLWRQMVLVGKNTRQLLYGGDLF